MFTEIIADGVEADQDVLVQRCAASEDPDRQMKSNSSYHTTSTLQIRSRTFVKVTDQVPYSRVFSAARQACEAGRTCISALITSHTITRNEPTPPHVPMQFKFHFTPAVMCHVLL